jgi:hypothetical protein
LLARKERSALEKYEGLRDEIKKVIEDDIVSTKFVRHIENMKTSSRLANRKQL